MRAAFCLVACVLWAVPATAQGSTDTAAGERPLLVRQSVKATFLRTGASGDPATATGGTASGLFRWRLDATWQASARVSAGAAYEMRSSVSSVAASLGGLGVLPPTVAAPYRLTQLDWSIASDSRASWRQEIDRAWVSVRTPRAELSVGRQAIGWGRGLVFSAIDLFSPFTSLEADREWRRGVDAARAEVKLTDHTSAEVVGAFGSTWNQSIVGGRVRGYAGNVDAEVVAGWRARDVFWGGTTSAAVGPAEVHAEVAVFHTPDPLPGHAPDDHTAVTAVLGASFRVPIGPGILTSAEYHYSGFGAANAAGMAALAVAPPFLARLVRGDVQIVGRHAAAVLASGQLSPEVTVSAEELFSPTDGSSVFLPSARIDLSDRWSLQIVGYVSGGARPLGGLPRSEYGAVPRGLFTQLKIDF